MIYRNLVITGSRNQETPQKGANGQVRAFDVRTGREVWHFNGVPGPGEKFHDTWEGDSWVARSGVNVWAGLTLDAGRGIAYLPFGAPTFDQSGNDRKGPFAVFQYPGGGECRDGKISLAFSGAASRPVGL